MAKSLLSFKAWKEEVQKKFVKHKVRQWWSCDKEERTKIKKKKREKEIRTRRKMKKMAQSWHLSIDFINDHNLSIIINEYLSMNLRSSVIIDKFHDLLVRFINDHFTDEFLAINYLSTNSNYCWIFAITNKFYPSIIHNFHDILWKW